MVSISVTVVTPVVTGTGVHLFSSHEVMVITVVAMSVTVELYEATAEPATAEMMATFENCIVNIIIIV